MKAVIASRGRADTVWRATPPGARDRKMTVVSADPGVTRILDEAREAFASSDWESARDHFQWALAAEITAEGLDGLGQTL